MADIPLDYNQPQAPQGFMPQNLPQETLQSGLAGYANGEQGQGVGVSKWDKWVSQVSQNFGQSVVGIPGVAPGSATRAFEEMIATGRSENAGTQKLTVEEASKKFPGVPFTEPLYPEVAQLRANNARHQAMLQDFVNRGPETGRLFNLASGAPTVLEPFNLVSNIALNTITGGLGIPSTLRNLFMQNIAINAASDVSNYYQLSKENGVAPDIGEMIKNNLEGAAQGALFMKGLHMAITGLKSRFAAPDVSVTSIGESTPVVEEKVKTLISQHENGAALDVAHLDAEARARLEGRVNPRVGPTPSDYVEAAHPSEKQYFAPISSEKGTPIPMNDFTEGGITGSEKGMQANNLASNPEGQFPGKVHQFSVSEKSNLLDVDQSATEGAGKKVIAAIEEKLGSKLEVPEGTTVKEVLSDLAQKSDQGGERASTLSQVQDAVKELGYQGYKYVSEDSRGQPIGDQVHLFDQADAQPVKTFEASPEATPQLSQGEIQGPVKEAQLPENSTLRDDKVDARVTELKVEKPFNPAPLDPVTENQARIADEYLKSRAELDPQLAEELAGQKEKTDDMTTVKKNESLAKLLKDCMIGGGQ